MYTVKAIGLHYVHIAANNHKSKTFLSTYWIVGDKYDVMDVDIQSALKYATGVLNYLELKGIPIDQINTHSLRDGGANALSLLGYTNREIQKMGRWKSNTFK